MSETKKRLEMFSFYDFTAIQRHLEKMARQGWRLVCAERGRWTYRRAEPAELHYAVVYFPDSSQYDPEPTEGQQTLRDYCLAAGWEPVADWGQMQIYCTDRPDPVPIDTEPSIQLETIHRTMKRTFLPGTLALMALFLLQLGMQFSDLYWEMGDYLSSGVHLSLLVMLLLVLAAECVDLGSYLLWRRRSKASIARGGGCVPSRGHRRLVWSLLGLAVLTVVWQMTALKDPAMGGFMPLYLAGLVGIIWVTWRIQSALKRRKFSRNANRAVTMGTVVVLSFLLMVISTAGLFTVLGAGLGERPPVETYESWGRTWNVYHDPIPLRVEDLMDTDYDGWSTETERQATPLAARLSAWQSGRVGEKPDVPDLDYEITDVRLPLLADAVWNSCLREVRRYDGRDTPAELRREYRPMDAALWGADAACRLYRDGEASDTYLLRWGSCMVRLGFREELTPEQMALAGEKLRGA